MNAKFNSQVWIVTKSRNVRAIIEVDAGVELPGRFLRKIKILNKPGICWDASFSINCLNFRIGRVLSSHEHTSSSSSLSSSSMLFGLSAMMVAQTGTQINDLLSQSKASKFYYSLTANVVVNLVEALGTIVGNWNLQKLIYFISKYKIEITSFPFIKDRRVRLNLVRVQTTSKCRTVTPVRTTRAKSRSNGRRSSKNFRRANSGERLP